MKMTRDREKKFLSALGRSANVTLAARAAGVSRANLYLRREAEAAFAALWNDAIEQAADRLEREAWRRAVRGVKEPVFFKGEKCGVVPRYSDSLLIALLRAARPEKFAVHQNIKSDSTVRTVVTLPQLMPPGIPDDELDAGDDGRGA